MRSVSSDVSGDPVYSSLLSSSPASSAVSVTVLHCIAFIVTHVVTLTLRCYIDIALLHQVVTLHFPPSHVGEQLRVRGDGSHQSVVSVVPLTVHMLPVTITTPPPYFHILCLSISSNIPRSRVKLASDCSSCGGGVVPSLWNVPPSTWDLTRFRSSPPLLWWLQCSPGTRYNCLEVSTECK